MKILNGNMISAESVNGLGANIRYIYRLWVNRGCEWSKKIHLLVRKFREDSPLLVCVCSDDSAIVVAVPAWNQTLSRAG